MRYTLLLALFCLFVCSLFSTEITPYKFPELESKKINYFVNAKGDISGIPFGRGERFMFFWNKDSGYINIPFIQELKSLGYTSEADDYHCQIIHFSDKGTIVMLISYSPKKMWPNTCHYVLAGWSLENNFKVLDFQSAAPASLSCKYIGNDHIELNLVDKSSLYHLKE